MFKDIFTLVVPIKKQQEISSEHTHQDTLQDALQDNFLRLLEFCKTARSRNEMMELLGLSDRVNFKKNYLDPLLERGLISMTIPDKPTSKNQKYIKN